MALLKLLRKDFFLNKKTLLIYAVFIAAFSAYMGFRVDSSRSFVFFLTLMAVLYAVLFYARDDKFRGSVLTCSLPVSRRMVVLSRYFNSLVWTFFFMACGLAAPLLLPGSKISAAAIFSFAVLGRIFWVVVLILCVFLPFIIAFGFVGVMVFLVSMQVLGIVVLVAAQLGLFRLNLRQISAGFKSLLTGLQSHVGLWGYRIALAAAALALLGASYALSGFLYRRKEF